VAFGVGDSSLASFVEQALRQAYNNKSFPLSVSELFSQILALARNGEERKDKSTPIHCTLTSEQSGRRIILQPLRQPVPEMPATINGIMIVNIAMSDGTNFDSENWGKDWKEWIRSVPRAAESLLDVQVLKNIEEEPDCKPELKAGLECAPDIMDTSPDL
jgi:hypothetical protein